MRVGRRLMMGGLVDGFGRQHTYLRVSLTERCNLRCRYCMPEAGVDLTPTDRLLSDDELHRLVGIFVSKGIDKIRLTGGEPLLRPNVEETCHRLSSLPGVKSVTVTTNGLLLGRKVGALRAAGLSGINLSLDTLDEEKFTLVTRRRGLTKVLDAIDTALHHGYDPVKVNCVVMKGFNDRELPDFVEMTRDKSVSVRFIEYMPFDGNEWSDVRFMSYRDQLTVVRHSYPTLERLEGSPSDTAKLWRVPGHAGTVGFISSMSDHFCEGCNRLRLTADGNLKVCLFGSDELNLKAAIQRGCTDDEICDMIQSAVDGKFAHHGGNEDMYAIAGSKNREMIRIGG